jgi:hypothetical protein
MIQHPTAFHCGFIIMFGIVFFSSFASTRDENETLTRAALMQFLRCSTHDFVQLKVVFKVDIIFGLVVKFSQIDFTPEKSSVKTKQSTKNKQAGGERSRGTHNPLPSP